MVVLCSDKTGTLTQNALTVTTVHPMSGFDEAHVLALAALASSDGGQDPVDGALRAAAASKAVADAPKLVKFAPLRSAKKMSEATANRCCGRPATHPEGRLRRGHRPCSGTPGRGSGGQGTRGQGLSGAGGRGRTARGDEARGTRRVERPRPAKIRRR